MTREYDQAQHDECRHCHHERILHDVADKDRGIQCIRVGASRSTGKMMGCPCPGFQK